MIFPTYTEPVHPGLKRQNKNIGFVQIINLIFSVCVIFLVPHRIAIAQTVHIPDPNLRIVLEAALDKAAGEDITQAEMASLESLDAFESGIRDLTGLESATNLIELHLGLNALSDISPLKDLINLTHLDLHRNQWISDVSALKNLTNLTWLSLRGNQVTNMSPLKDLTKLTYLHVAYNRISSVSAFENLTNLTFLDFESHIISDLSPLRNLTKLTYLDFDSNWVSDVSVLRNLTELRVLDASDNRISDVSALENLTKLTSLDLDDNQISDISVLQNLTKLTLLDLDDNQNISDVSSLQNMANLEWLDLDDNKISDLSPLKDLTKLTYLDLNDNLLLEVSPLQNLTKLIELDLDDNQISDISPLQNLTELTLLDLHDNQISDISPLQNLTKLIELDLDDNKIVDVSPLKNLVNLTVLDLSGNHISDFSPISGLLQNLVGYDAGNQTEPPFMETDVNRDGIVNVIDLALAASYYRNPNFAEAVSADIYPDVNSDGVIDVKDLVSIAAQIDTDAAAAALRQDLSETSNLTVKALEQWIHLAKQLDPQELRTQRGIVVLGQLLAAFTTAEAPPKTTALLANYPNPFNPETWIPYQLAKSARVCIYIHSADGKLVRILELGQLSAGAYHQKSRAVHWDGRNEFGETVASGVYFFTLIAGDFTATRKMIIRK